MLPSLAGLPWAPPRSLGVKRGRASFETVEVVPKEKLDDFLEMKLASVLRDSWLEYAESVLPQSGVINGDWEGKYDIATEFPIVEILKNNYGNKWKKFLKALKDRESKSVDQWVIHDDVDEDEFEKLVNDFKEDNYFEGWTDSIKNTEDVDSAITSFQTFVKEWLRNEKGEEEEEDEEEKCGCA